MYMLGVFLIFLDLWADIFSCKYRSLNLVQAIPLMSKYSNAPKCQNKILSWKKNALKNTIAALLLALLAKN